MKRPILSEEERRLLELRKERKSRMPEFIRYESWRDVRVKENWRRPRNCFKPWQGSYPNRLVGFGLRSPKFTIFKGSFNRCFGCASSL